MRPDRLPSPRYEGGRDDFVDVRDPGLADAPALDPRRLAEALRDRPTLGPTVGRGGLLDLIDLPQWEWCSREDAREQ